MTSSGLSSTDMLISNLDDHQVIRIEGSQPWMRQLVEQVKQHQPDFIECRGVLDLQSIQLELSEYLGVEPGASFIQQAFKHRLEADRKLLVTINAASIDVQALTYLLGLPSICNEQGSAVTVLLLSNQDLVSTLKATPSLAAKLDGYYQEERETVTPAPFKLNNMALLMVGVVGIGCAGWYLSSMSSDHSGPRDNKTPNIVQTSPVLIDDSSSGSSENVAPSSQTAEPKSVQPIEENANKSMTDYGSTDGQVTSLESIEPSPKASQIVELPKKGITNPALLAELTETVTKAKQKKTGVMPGVNQKKTIDLSIAKANEVQKKVENDTRRPIHVVSTMAGPALQAKETISTPTVGVSPARLNNEAEVRKVVEAWGKAWESQDWDAYIGSYLENTTLYGVKMSLEEWRAFRKNRLLSPQWIKLELGKPNYTRLNSHWYRAEFYQRFEKPGYADETTKRLELTLTSNGWRIASEAADGTIVLSRPSK